MDHFYLDSVCILLCLDMGTRYSTAYVVSSKSMEQEIIGFEASCLFQFSIPEAVQTDSAFKATSFKKYLDARNASLRLVPKHCHCQTPLERKHGVIPSIYLKLCAGEPDVNIQLFALCPVSISNDLYGNNVMPSSELAKFFTKAIDDACVYPTTDDVVETQAQLHERPKLALILMSNSVEELSGTARD